MPRFFLCALFGSFLISCLGAGRSFAGPTDQCKIFEIVPAVDGPNRHVKLYTIYIRGERMYYTPPYSKGWFFQSNQSRFDAMAAELTKLRDSKECGPIFQTRLKVDPQQAGLTYYLKCGGTDLPCEDGEQLSGRRNEPTRPLIAEVKDAKGNPLAGLTELVPGSGVLVGSRHLFSGSAPKSIEDALKSAQVKPSGVQCFEFFRRNALGKEERLDVIVAAPKNSAALSFEIDDEVIRRCEAGAASQPLRYRMRLGPELAGKVRLGVDLGDKYFSHQLGSVGPEASQSISRGRIGSRTVTGRFFLPSPATANQEVSENRSTLRSSGSLVYVQREGSREWRIGGIVECVVPKISGRDSGKGLDIPGATRVISMDSLLDAYAVPSSCTSPSLLKAEKRNRQCIPIDARGGGGV